VNVNCISYPSGSGSEIDCSATFSEAFNTISWTTTGPASPTSQSSGSKQFTTFGPPNGTITVQAEVCFNAVCTTSPVATVQIGQTVSQLEPNLCNGFIFDPYTAFPLTAQILNWNSSKPVPTGVVTWIVNGNIVASAPVQPTSAQPTADSSFTVGEPFQSGLPLTVQYSGDSNWTAAAISCTFESGGGP
jgi:hypothetical protein